MASEEELTTEEKESVELVKEETAEGAEEAPPTPEAYEDEAEAIEYDITSPDLLEAMLEKADLLELISQGKMSLEQAKLIVKTQIESKVASSLKPQKRARRTVAPAQRASRRRARKSTSTKKTSKSRRRKKKEEASGSSS